jgi:hypothetical protein
VNPTYDSEFGNGDESEFVCIICYRDQQQVANRLQMWSSEVGTALSRKAESIHVYNIIDILRHRKAAGHIDVVVVSAQEKIVAKVEVLFFAMAGDPLWKLRAQPLPNFITFLPWRDFGDFESLHCHKEWRREVGPLSVAHKVHTVKRIPRRLHNVASERCSWIGALADDATRGGFDRNSVGCEKNVPVWLAERANGRSFLMKRGRHLNGMGKHLKTFHRPQAPAADVRSSHFLEFVPSIKAAVCGNSPCKQVVVDIPTAATVILVDIPTAATVIMVDIHPTPTVATPITRKTYCRTVTAATNPSATRRD